MPAWGKADFDRFYRTLGERWGRPNTRSPVWLHYHWWPIIRWQASDYAPRLASLLGLNAGDAVVLVGAGFNGTGAGLEALGIEVVGIDTSSYILNEKANTEEAEIRDACLAVGLDPDADTVIGPPGNVDVNPLDLWLEGGRANPAPRGKGQILGEDMSNRPSRNAVRRALNSDPRYGITEEVLNSISDSEALQVCDHAAQFAGETGATIVHMLSPRQEGATQAAELNWKSYAEWRAFLDGNGFADQSILPTVTVGGVAAYSGLI